LSCGGAAEGITWWHEFIPPDLGDFEVQRKLIERGPLRMEQILDEEENKSSNP
jgi:hypothetical protein